MSQYYAGNGNGQEIAVIGMAGRFPGAKDINRFWENLKNGVESITFFSEEELLAEGFSAELLKKPGYVKCGGGQIDNIDYFDAAFFGYSPVEAKLMDPQVRIFHECVWHALENAGYDPFSTDKLIGIYAGATGNFNWEAFVLMSGQAAILGHFTSKLFYDQDFLCTRISYNLNLKGPAIVMKTACSTSLVAVHTACQAILNGECDMALTGGVSIISLLKKMGYMYEEGMVTSPDGHCRAFDENAMGTISGSGAGVVVLKRLEDAVDDNDHILAVIKGSAINNDGLRKAGFTAPSIEGQSEVISDALQIAGVEPETITYIETHGTGTPVGDPIEIEALKIAFNTPKKQYCRIGSIKTNMGHLEAAAGIAGFIKTVLALKFKLIPPSLHYKAPNPRIDFENSPFIVNTVLWKWENNGQPLRAGVSAFGIGGTNAHIVLEEWPSQRNQPNNMNLLDKRMNNGTGREYQLIVLSAKTQTALDQATGNLAAFLKENKGINLADTAFTLQAGRRSFPYRRMVVCPDIDSIITALASPGTPGAKKVKTAHAKEEKRSIIFMFPGLGAEYIDMGLGLYQTEPLFRDEIDACFSILNSIAGFNMKTIIYPGETKKGDSRDHNFRQPGIVQPLLFIFEYALARLLIQWGIKPHALIGYSLGEYTAACLSGVFSLEDALKIIVARGKLIETLPTGIMLSVPLASDAVKPFLNDQLAIAIDNGPSCIVSGPAEALAAFQNELKKERCLCIPLPNSHAIHSPMMNPILNDFETYLDQIPLHKPQIPYISNVTGEWITVQDATNPGYWAAHLKQTVRFADGIQRLLSEVNPLFIEIGPGRDLSTLLVRHKDSENEAQYHAVSLIKPASDQTPGNHYFFNKLGQLWLYGVNINWNEFYKDEQRARIPLPLYPFERQRYWIESDPFQAGQPQGVNPGIMKKKDLAEWLYTQQWHRSTLIEKEYGAQAKHHWLLFIDDSPLCHNLAKHLEDNHHSLVIVKTGENFQQLKPGEYTINPSTPGDYDSLFKTLAELGKVPDYIAHLWCLAPSLSCDLALESGLFSLLDIARAIGKTNITHKIQLGIITSNMQFVTGEEELCPGKAALLGPVKIIPLEYANIFCRSIDIIDPGENKEKITFFIENLPREFYQGFEDQPIIAYRGICRWQEAYTPVAVKKGKGLPGEMPVRRLKEKGVYLVTGGFGGMGFVLAEHLVNTLDARLILVDILTPPTGEKLDKWLYSEERKKDIRDKKQKIKEWESRGAEILIHDMDISNYQGMQDVISQAEKHFGPINGVIHTAGLIDYAGVIQRRTREMTAVLLEAKIKGTLVIDELLKHHPLDFVVLFSSIGNVLYKVKFGQVGYNAGHEFMDIFSYYKQQQGQYTVTIDWNDWSEVGMGARVSLKHHTGGGSTTPSKDPGSILTISPSEGMAVFRHIIETNLPRVVVAEYDLQRLMEFESKPAAGTQGKTAAVDADIIYDRPGLSTDYVPPANELEQFIIDTWEKIFGFKKIGITDDWFELGGDSLTVVQLFSRIKEIYPVEISVNVFFEKPTPAGLAGMITELLYEKIRDLSEEEVDALAAQDGLI
ncbi:MAG TPA: beta-ketoacyl synthase N-terminal-like domain-containing protein [Candidatus Kapabacteria bacterium]|nr:beta-ketoacyl synthase N-terminal-like domain-containing protein [Candidatus Kapabacteria bacterium]